MSLLTYDPDLRKDVVNIVQVQARLKLRGKTLSDRGPNGTGFTGEMDDETIAALKSLQADIGVAETGELDFDTLFALENMPVPWVPPAQG